MERQGLFEIAKAKQVVAFSLMRSNPNISNSEVQQSLIKHFKSGMTAFTIGLVRSLAKKENGDIKEGFGVPELYKLVNGKELPKRNRKIKHKRVLAVANGKISMKKKSPTQEKTWIEKKEEVIEKDAELLIKGLNGLRDILFKDASVKEIVFTRVGTIVQVEITKTTKKKFDL